MEANWFGAGRWTIFSRTITWLRVARASRVLAMVSRHRELFETRCRKPVADRGKACFGATPTPAGGTHAVARPVDPLAFILDFPTAGANCSPPSPKRWRRD